MNSPEQKVMFNKMGVKTFYIGKIFDDPTRARGMLHGSKNVLYDIF